MIRPKAGERWIYTDYRKYSVGIEIIDDIWCKVVYLSEFNSSIFKIGLQCHYSFSSGNNWKYLQNQNIQQ